MIWFQIISCPFDATLLHVSSISKQITRTHLAASTFARPGLEWLACRSPESSSIQYATWEDFNGCQVQVLWVMCLSSVWTCFFVWKKTKSVNTSKSDNNEALQFQQFPIFSHTHLGSPEWFLRWLHADVRAHGQVPGVTACRLGLGLRWLHVFQQALTNLTTLRFLRSNADTV